MWFFFSFLFFVGLIYWSLGLRNSWAHKQHIHVLMTVLVILKVLTMLVDGIKLNYMAREGTGSGWDYIWFVLYGVKGAALFIVIVLIGSGWSFVKPFLSDRDKRIVMVILPLQVVNNIALVVTEEENMGNQDWAAWRDVLHLFDIICCCAILFPIVWSIKHLREAAATDGKAAVNAEKLTLFRQFYMVRIPFGLPPQPWADDDLARCTRCSLLGHPLIAKQDAYSLDRSTCSCVGLRIGAVRCHCT